MSKTLLTFAQVSSKVALGRTSIYAGIAASTFPAPVKLGKASRWVESEIDGWMDARVAERDMVESMGSSNAA